MIHVQLILNVFEQRIVRQHRANVLPIIILIHQNINVFANNLSVNHAHNPINVLTMLLAHRCHRFQINVNVLLVCIMIQQLQFVEHNELILKVVRQITNV